LQSIFISFISRETARQWLHKMGFYFKTYSKDVYYDGHEREDVIEYRKKFLETMKKYL